MQVSNMSPVNNSPGDLARGFRSPTPLGIAATSLAAVIGMFISLSTVCAQGPGETEAKIRFEGYPGAPDVEVVPRKADLFFYPCDQCHASMEPNPEIRQLDTLHDTSIEHGRGRIWCLSCHDFKNRDYLRTLLGERVDFDDAHIVCGGCHANRHKDWSFGVHGKRVANWSGDRVQYNCTHCHNAHSPAIPARAPKPPPPVRAGLAREDGAEHNEQPTMTTEQK